MEKQKRGPKPGQRHAGQFKPGQSGNPNGRPPSSEPLSEAIRRKIGHEKVIEILMGLIASTDESIKLRALEFIVERGWGKAPQPVEHSGEVGHRMVLVFPSGATNG